MENNRANIIIKELPQDVRFAYSIEKSINPIFHQHINSKKYVINYSNKTDVLQSTIDNKVATIVGLCIDSHEVLERNQIAKWIVSNWTSNPTDIFNKCDRLAGKYIVLVEDENSAYIWGDATCSLQLNYSFKNDDLCIAFSDKVVSQKFNYRISNVSKDIRDKGSKVQPLPYDLTMYDEVKALLPNHYLDINNKTSVRVNLNIEKSKEPQEINEVIIRSAILAENIARQYGKYYDFACPITSGYDSRVVYSIFNSLKLDKVRYTFKHKGFSMNTADIAVPHKFITDSSKDHIIVDDLEAPEAFKNQVINFLGEWQDVGTINLAYTYINNFPNFALTNGDIIGQIGKSSVANAVPNLLITPQFMRCKIHTCSSSTIYEFKKYSKQIKRFEKKENMADLFVWESRLGRWATQGGLVYAFCGITLLNIFNCREIIKLFIKVPPKFRVHEKIHEQYLNIFNPQLLKYPFNPDDKYTWAKNNWILFYIGTYAKYVISIVNHNFNDNKL